MYHGRAARGTVSLEERFFLPIRSPFPKRVTTTLAEQHNGTVSLVSLLRSFPCRRYSRSSLFIIIYSEETLNSVRADLLWLGQSPTNKIYTLYRRHAPVLVLLSDERASPRLAIGCFLSTMIYEYSKQHNSNKFLDSKLSFLRWDGRESDITFRAQTESGWSWRAFEIIWSSQMRKERLSIHNCGYQV